MFDREKYNEYIQSCHIEYINNRYICPICNAELYKRQVSSHIKTHFGYIPPKVKGHLHTPEQRKKISEGMKLAHKEKRAYNIGYVTNRQKASYPEIFFMKVIKNHFNDKYYVYNYQFHQYQLDFAWVHLKKSIEIDGEQHYRFQEYYDRDRRKDAALYNEGWKVLHIRWINMFNEPHKWIDIAKTFIEGDNDIDNIELLYKQYLSECRVKIKKKCQKRENSKYNRVRRYTKNIEFAHDIALKVNEVIDTVDMTKFGWVKKVSDIAGISPNKGRDWVSAWCPWLLDNAYTRKN